VGYNILFNREKDLNVKIVNSVNIHLSLAPQPSLGLGLLHKIWLNFLEASQQSFFLQGRVVSPTPNPHPRGPGLCIYIPQRQGGPVIPLGTHFSCFLMTRMGYGETILIPRSPHGDVNILGIINNTSDIQTIRYRA
jgi:hypothetical protein